MYMLDCARTPKLSTTTELSALYQSCTTSNDVLPVILPILQNSGEVGHGRISKAQ